MGVTEADGPAIDDAALDRNTGGDRALQDEVLALFLGQIDQLLDALSSAAPGRDRFMYAHAIKGGARNVGALRLARLAEEMEHASETAHEVVFATLVPRARAEVVLMRQAVEARRTD